MAPRPPGSPRAEGSRYYALSATTHLLPLRGSGTSPWLTGNDGDVSVVSGLAGRRAVFKADIEAIGPEFLLAAAHEPRQRLLLFDRELVYGEDMLAGRYEGVASGNRIRVRESNGLRVFQQDSARGYVAKCAGLQPRR